MRTTFTNLCMEWEYLQITDYNTDCPFLKIPDIETDASLKTQHLGVRRHDRMAKHETAICFLFPFCSHSAQVLAA